MLFTSFNMFLPDETGNLLKNMAVQTLQNKSKTLLLLGMIGSQLLIKFIKSKHHFTSKMVFRVNAEMLTNEAG